MKKIFAFLLLVLGAQVHSAPLQMPSFFSDNMVLQQGIAAPLWGKATPGKEVTVRFRNHDYHTTALSDGKWTLKLAPQKAGGPYTVQIKSEKESLEFKNVLIGEVWVCSGQSNMQWDFRRINNAAEEVANANYPKIRLLLVQSPHDGRIREDIETEGGQWRECSPESIPKFSTTAYFFARTIFQKTGVPIGLISGAVGGSDIEAWIPGDALYNTKGFEMSARMPSRSGLGWHYNRMIAPLATYGIRGVIWYQGESNTGRADQYRTLLPILIQSWRAVWQQGDFPFYYMQLPIYGDKEDTEAATSSWAELREAQRQSLSVANTGMAVTIDFNDPDLHPRNKQDFGQRLALIPLAKLYRQKIDYQGPLYKGCRVEGNAMRIFFSNPKVGLKSRDGEALKGFVMAGEDQKFYLAEAKIDGSTIVVTCDKVTKPFAVRYASSQRPVNNLVSEASLPASPFRTDHWKWITEKH